MGRPHRSLLPRPVLRQTRRPARRRARLLRLGEIHSSQHPDLRGGAPGAHDTAEAGGADADPDEGTIGAADMALHALKANEARRAHLTQLGPLPRPQADTPRLSFTSSNEPHKNPLPD